MEGQLLLQIVKENLGGGNEPMGSSYGKLMMCFLSYQML
jgi:hypothetical protein